MLIEYEVEIELIIIRLVSFQYRRLEHLIDIILDQQEVFKYVHDFDNRMTNPWLNRRIRKWSGLPSLRMSRQSLYP